MNQGFSRRALLTIGLLCVGVATILAWMQFQQRDAQQRLEISVARTIERAERQLEQARRSLSSEETTRLAHKALAGELGANASLRRRLRQIIPDLAADTELLPAEQIKRIEGRNPYSRLNLLVEARLHQRSRPRLLKLRENRAPRLVIAQAIRPREGQVAPDFFWMELRPEALARVLPDNLPFGAGLAVVQDDTVFLSTRELMGPGVGNKLRPIEGTDLAVASAYDQPGWASVLPFPIAIGGMLLMGASALQHRREHEAGDRDDDRAYGDYRAPVNDPDAGGDAEYFVPGEYPETAPGNGYPDPGSGPGAGARGADSEVRARVSLGHRLGQWLNQIVNDQSAREQGLSSNIFRAYDIRGIVGETLTANIMRDIGRAVATASLAKGVREVVVGRDGRLSGPELSQALQDGIMSAGANVIDIGQVPTPVLYYATHKLGQGSGVIVTGSHNPPDYNGAKIMIAGVTLAGAQIQDLYRRIALRDLATGEGERREAEIIDQYCADITERIQLDRELHVVADYGNGVAGAIGPRVLESIGAYAHSLYAEVDGKFPNHHPDPSDPANLRDLHAEVKRRGAHLGLAFDGDGDRLGVMLPSGEIVWADRLLMLFARDVLSRHAGAQIIFDVKCTGLLARDIEQAGGKPVMWRTGHSLIKRKMKEARAPLAGEMSGHFFFADDWYGFDDGIYAAARLLQILAAGDKDAAQALSELPAGYSTPEIKVETEEGMNHHFVRQFQEQATFRGAQVRTIDGVRVDFPDGWGLVRGSNTTPVLVLRFEGDNEAAMRRIQEKFRSEMLKVDPKLKLPF